MIRVSSLDAGMLYAETPEMPMHTIGVLILEHPGHSIFERLRTGLEERLHLLEPFRRRLVEGPLRLGDPHWIEDPAFSLDNHLHRAAIPDPAGMPELACFVGDLAGRLLDRSQPLWEMHLVEKLRGGKAALVVKVHHAAMDGGRLVAMMNTLLDLSARGRKTPGPAGEWTPDPEPSLAWFAADTSRTLAAKPLNALRALSEIGSALFPRPRTHGEHRQADADDEGGRARVFEAPKTPFNGALSSQRVVAMADVAMADVKRIKNAFGTTVNDVVLAAGSAALRAWLMAHGGLPDEALVANVPVTVRGRGDGETAAGNRVSMILVHLPVRNEDPVDRLMAINAETQSAKARHGHGKGDVFRQTADLLTNVSVPWLLTQVMELYSRSDLGDRLPLFWNLVISNLPGPPQRLYCAGARVLRIYPFGPVQLGSGLNLTVMSTMGRLCLGAMACRRMVPDVEEIASAFRREVAVLKQRALAQEAPPAAK